MTVLRLLHERGLGTSSPFHSYLSVLPHDHRLPLEWNETELGLLQVRLAQCPRDCVFALFSVISSVRLVCQPLIRRDCLQIG